MYFLITVNTCSEIKQFLPKSRFSSSLYFTLPGVGSDFQFGSDAEKKKEGVFFLSYFRAGFPVQEEFISYHTESRDL